MDSMLLTPTPVFVQFWRLRVHYGPSSTFGVRCFGTCFWAAVKVLPITYVHVKYVIGLISLGIKMAKSVEVRDIAVPEVVVTLLPECEHSVKLTGTFPVSRKRSDWRNYHGISFIHEHFGQAVNATPIVEGTK
jgi:hypothetical protein